MPEQQRADAFLKRIESWFPNRPPRKTPWMKRLPRSGLPTPMWPRCGSGSRPKRRPSSGRGRRGCAQSGVRQAESGVAGQQAALGRAEARRMAAKSAPKQVAQSRSQTSVAEAEVARAEAEVGQARLNLTYTKIYAPISGHVTRKSVELGATCRPVNRCWPWSIPTCG